MTDKSQRAGKIFRSLKEIDRHIGRLAERLWPINTQSNNPEPQSTAEQLAEIEGQAQYILPAGWQKVPLGEPLKGGDEYHEGLDRYIRRIESQSQPETTAEQLAEIEGQAEDTPATEYTPPEGWRVLRSGELLQPGDHWVSWEGTVSRPDIQHGDGATVSGGRYIRWVKPQPQPDIRPIEPGKTQELPEYTPPEGWRVLAVGEELREGDVIVHADDAMYATARAGKVVQANQRYIRPIEPQPQSELQQADTPATEYTPPEGWRVLQAGERLRFGDIAVKEDGSCCSTERAGGWVGSYQRYIRPIEPEPVQVREGRWRTRGRGVKDVTRTPPGHELADDFPWWDGSRTFRNDGRYAGFDKAMDLVEYLGPIKQQLQPEPQAAAIEELRSEVSYVQRLLGESRQRVTHLEELVSSLRTINEAQEKSFNAANKANDDLQHRLDVVSKEWADQAATSNGLRAQLDKRDAQIRDLKIELDSLQQVPADSAPMANNDVISRSDAVDAVVLTAVEHVVAIVARLHNTQVTPELHNTIVQAIGQLTAQLPEQHDAAIPPVVAEHCDAMPTLVQSVFYNIPDAG